MRLLTHDAPLGLTTRYASREVFIDTVGLIPRGAMIDVDLASASLRSDAGAREDRRHAQSYVFGAGAHRCPGDRLAMLEAQAYLEGLLALDAAEYAPVVADEPRPSTFRHLPWQALERTTNSLAGTAGGSGVGDA
jgi:cytochrome P450